MLKYQCYLVKFQSNQPTPKVDDPSQSVQIQSEVQTKPTVNGGVQHSNGAAENEDENDQSMFQMFFNTPL